MNTKVDLLNKTYGQIYIHDGVAVQGIATGATYKQLLNFMSTNMGNDCTPDYANNRIIITRAGTYKIHFQVSFTSGTNNVQWLFAAHCAAAEIQQCHSKKFVGTGAQTQDTTCDGILSGITAGQQIDLRVQHDNGGTVNITLVFANITIERVGD